MAAKHARHDMRKDKNFKGSDPSELTAQSLYCAFVKICIRPYLFIDRPDRRLRRSQLDDVESIYA
jgi:hypothetical protein